MKDSFDVDVVLFSLLKGSPASMVINGGIYTGDDRPDDSELEDIVIRNISLTQDCHPQTGVSNVNIYARDREVTIFGRKQLKADRKRLDELSKAVLQVLRDARIAGFGLVIENQTVLAEASVKQHFTNIRVRMVLE